VWVVQERGDRGEVVRQCPIGGGIPAGVRCLGMVLQHRWREGEARGDAIFRGRKAWPVLTVEGGWWWCLGTIPVKKQRSSDRQ
jgi:hypothetical protein